MSLSDTMFWEACEIRAAGTERHHVFKMVWRGGRITLLYSCVVDVGGVVRGSIIRHTR